MGREDSEVKAFVGQALKAGQSREAIRSALQGAGWDRHRIDAALSAYAEIDFPLPVPRPKPSLSAKEGFLYFLLIVTLYLTAVNLGTLIFELINLAIPDPAKNIQLNETVMRWAVASLIVFGPVYGWLALSLERRLAKDPVRRQSPIRKWLIYLTLLTTALVFLGDLARLLYEWLDGSLSLRFFLKALVVAIIAGGIYAYYRWQVREDLE